MSSWARARLTDEAQADLRARARALRIDVYVVPSHVPNPREYTVRVFQGSDHTELTGEGPLEPIICAAIDDWIEAAA